MDNELSNKKWYPRLEWLRPVMCACISNRREANCTVIKMVLQYCFINKVFFFFNRRLQLWQLRLVHWLAGHLVLFLGKYICLHLWWRLQSVKSLFFPVFLGSWYFFMENFLYRFYCFRLPIAWDILVRQRRIIYFLELCLVSLILFLVSRICYMSWRVI